MRNDGEDEEKEEPCDEVESRDVSTRWAIARSCSLLIRYRCSKGSAGDDAQENAASLLGMIESMLESRSSCSGEKSLWRG